MKFHGIKMKFHSRELLIDFLVWTLIVLVPITGAVSLATLAKLEQLVKDTRTTSMQQSENLIRQTQLIESSQQKTQDYIRCVADALTKAPVISINLDTCTVDSKTSGVSIPTQTQTPPQNPPAAVSAPPATPQPPTTSMQCTVQLFTLCL